MLKMLLDPMGGLVLSNDGNAILREIEVAHPAAKSMIELARAQDEAVGDGTTSVIVLCMLLWAGLGCVQLLQMGPEMLVVVSMGVDGGRGGRWGSMGVDGGWVG